MESIHCKSYLRNNANISLHFFGFNFIPRETAKSEISLTKMGSKLGEHRGVTYTLDTNYIINMRRKETSFLNILKNPNQLNALIIKSYKIINIVTKKS